MIRSLIIALFIFKIGFSQNYKQTTFNSENGLSSPSIFCITKDSKGYIWLGTNTGVVRYDGKDFVQFELKDGLSAYSVYQIYEDDEGKIWFMTDTGEPNYYYEGKFYNPANTPILAKLTQSSFLYGFAQDKKKNTWIGSFNHGLKVLTDDEEIISSEDFDSLSISQKRIIKIWPYLPDQAIIAGGKYIFCLDVGSKKKVWEIEVFNPSTYIMRCNKISENLILAFCANEAAIVDVVKKKVIKKWSIGSIAEIIYVGDTHDDQNLIGTRNGLFSFKNGEIVPHELNEKLSNYAICDVLKDDLGNIWVATLHNGLLKFGNYPIKKDERFFTISDPISSFQFDSKGALLIGTQGNEFYRFNKSLQHFPFKEAKSVVHTILELSEKDFLVFAENRVDYLKGSQKFTLMCAIKAVQLSKNKKTMYLGHAMGTTKISTEEFLKTMIGKDEKTLLTLLTNNVDSPEYVNTLLLEDDKRLIIGSKSGLYIRENDKTELFKNKELTDKLYVFKVLSLEPNVYVLGTIGNGLVIVNSNTKKVRQINTTNGLADNFVTNLYIAPDSKIWVRHNLGFSSVDLKTDVPLVKNFGSSDGLDNSVVYALTSFEGKILVGTGSGIYSFNEYEMEQFRNFPSSFHFDSIIKNKLSERIKNDEVSIDADTDFRINFDFINYNLGEKITYNYHLKGYSTAWLQTESEQISYAGMKAGDYELEIFAENLAGNKSPVARLKITISNPWYKTTVAQLSFLLLIIGSIYSLFRAKILHIDKTELKEIWTKLKNLRKKTPEELTLIIKKTDGSIIKLKHSDLIRISAAGNYVEFHTLETKHLSRITMKEVDELLKGDQQFIRIHRSHFINTTFAKGMYQNKLRLDKTELPIGNKFMPQVEQIFLKS